MPPRLSSSLANGSQAKPIIRAQSDDGPPAIRIPTPEELGLGSKSLAANEPLDWPTVERKLDSAGMTSYQMERTASGFRFTCKLASRSIVGNGASRDEAVRKALDQLK